MSADSYQICPKCIDTFLETQAILAADIELKYGEIPFEEWVKLGAQRKDYPGDESFRTVRCYHETYLDDWDLNFTFGASCDVCNYAFELPFQTWSTR